MKLTSKKISLDQLYLDPNNYRFIDNKDYVFVDDKDITTQRVQTKTLRLLLGIGQEGISDLVSSIKSNGFLEFEQIQVRPLDKDKYLVVEGNRRVAALKTLKKQYEESGEFKEFMPDSYDKILVSVISGFDAKDNYIAMGLQHIGGKKKWNPLNQARLLRDLFKKQNMNENEICNSLGIGRSIIRTRMRALALADIYMASDYGDQFKSDMFSIFEEIVKKTELKIWLGWDDTSSSCTNQLNQERLFNWISFIDEEDHQRQEPIIMKSAEIRELAGFINDDKAIQIMESSRSFSEGKLNITTGTSVVKQSISSINKEVNKLFENEDSISNNDYLLIKSTLDKIEKIFSDVKIAPNTIISRQLARNHNAGFSSVIIKKFRGIRDLAIDDLSCINLFVGDNNSGKTSLLEAIYLLTQMNDINKYLSIERFRAKVENGISPTWLSEYLDNNYEIQGTFADMKYSVEYKQYKDGSLKLDKQGYLSTMNTAATCEGESDTYRMMVHLYERKDFISNNNEVVCICPAAFSSAYRRNKKALLMAYSTVIENNQKSLLVDFIKDNFDEQITDINLVGEGDDSRFMVTSRKFDKAVDITKYGEGLQRILEISLYVISCANGCVFIDEIDSAVHKNLLDVFIKYIVKLCKEHNVQLFTSTHNRECVDSFVKIQNEVNAYKLEHVGDTITAKYSDAKSLLPLMEQFNIDIR